MAAACRRPAASRPADRPRSAGARVAGTGARFGPGAIRRGGKRPGADPGRAASGATWRRSLGTAWMPWPCQRRSSPGGAVPGQRRVRAGFAATRDAQPDHPAQGLSRDGRCAARQAGLRGCPVWGRPRGPSPCTPGAAAGRVRPGAGPRPGRRPRRLPARGARARSGGRSCGWFQSLARRSTSALAPVISRSGRVSGSQPSGGLRLSPSPSQNHQ